MTLADRKKKLRDKMKNDVKNKDSGVNFGKMPLDLSKYTDVSFYDPKSGTKIKDDVFNCAFDIIPWIVQSNNYPSSDINKGDLAYKIIYLLHRGIGPSKTDQLICPRTIGKNCPICEEWKVLMDSGKKTEADKISPSYRVVYNIIDLNNPDEGIQLFTASRKYFDVAMMAEIDIAEKRSGEEVNIDENHIEFRATIDVWNKRKYFKFSNFEFEKREEDDVLIEQAYPIEEMLTILSYEKIKSIFYNEENSEPRDEPKDEKEEKKPSTERKQKEKSKEETTDKALTLEEMSLPELRRYIRKNNIHIKATRDMSKEKILELMEEKEAVPNDKCEFGHVFGKDCDEFDDCGSCKEDVWEKCTEKFEKNEVPY